MWADGMVYTRGSRDDWDRWAKVTDTEALNWDNILPLIRKVNTSTFLLPWDKSILKAIRQKDLC
jgi:hypothetical protein